MELKTLAQHKQDLDAKKYSSRELTQFYLDRIAKYDSQLNSFITVTADSALAAADNADKQRAAGKAGPLAGLPIAHKDIFCTQGVKTSCGSKMLDNFIAPYTATAVQRMTDAGCVMLGKTNMDEFAMGSSNENSYYGDVKNPWDLTTVPGGSSGGSAAAVASYLAPAATGTDTGGSIRQPAALTGLTGLKPTYGRVSRYGMVAFASSLDQGGPMAHSAEDCALLLNAMAGFDPLDSTSVEKDVPDYTATLNESLKGLKIGLPKEFFVDDLDKDIAAAVQQAVEFYQSAGATIHEIELPHTDLGIPAYYVVAPAECSSNLSRFDGVRYGHRCEDPKDLLDLYTRSRAEGFGTEVQRRIMIGTYALSAGYYDAYYLKAQKVRQLIAQDFTDAFKDVDVILGPTTPDVAFGIGEKAADPVRMYLSDVYTVTANLAGIPGLSLPCGMKDGKPIGLQLLGNYFDEARLLNVAHQYQLETEWHTQVPGGFA